MSVAAEILSDLTVHMKYARYLEDKQRRETWEEIVTRNMEMHVKKYPEIENEIREAYKYVFDKKVLPSMRSLQFAGKPIEISPNRIFNCAYMPVDDIHAFSEAMFLLLGGCFHGETLVKTFEGDKRIDEITNRDIVLTYDENNSSYEWTRPLAAGVTPTEKKDKIELEFEDGSIVRCTEDHKFLTSNRGWVKAKDLKDSDDIVSECFLEELSG